MLAQYFEQKKGWLAPSWPVEHGGAAWAAFQRHIFEEEACLANAPRILPFGLAMLAPVLIAFGSDDQRKHYLGAPQKKVCDRATGCRPH